MIKFSGQSKFFPLQQVSTCDVSLREKLSHQNFGIYSHMLCVSLIIYHYSSVRGTLHELLSQMSYRYTRNLRLCRGGVGSCSVCDNFENSRFCVVKFMCNHDYCAHGIFLQIRLMPMNWDIRNWTGRAAFSNEVQTQVLTAQEILMLLTGAEIPEKLFKPF